MNLRLTALLAVLAAVATVVIAAPTASAAKPGTGSVSVPVTGTFTDALGGVGDVAGTFTVTRFTTQDGSLAAVGTFTGTATDSTGAIVATGTERITVPLQVAQATCEILDLTLGPLDLDLLGLQVHLDQVHLVIEAEPGQGNLLGNLLCAVAGLLDSPGGLSGLLNQIVSLLNQILGQLGG